jgi:tetratricopeptide (TPR) repeat protein
MTAAEVGMRDQLARSATADASSGAPSIELQAGSEREWSWHWPALLVAAVAVVAYWNSLSGGFVFDDHGLLFANRNVTPGMRPWDWFTRESSPTSLYRPLTMVTFALNAAFAPTAFWYHALNVTIHALASIAAFVLASRLLPSRRHAAVAALLFAAHPIHTEAVANVAGRAELLAALFVFSALWAALRHVDDGWWGWLAMTTVAALAGVFSKESAVTLPLLAIVVLVWKAPTLDRRTLGVLAAVGFACVAYLGARLSAVGTLGQAAPPPWVDNPLAHVGVVPRIETALVVLSQYFGSLTLPVRLSADETFNQVPLVEGPTDVRLLSALALFAVLAAAAFSARRRAPAAWAGGLFAAAALAITANVLFPIGTIKAERLLYLPSFGWCVACAGLLALRPRESLYIAAVVVTLFVGRDWMRNEDWRDDYHLFTATAVTSPNSAKALSNAGAVHAQQGEFNEALASYRMATRIDPHFVPAEIGVGRLLAMAGRPAEALDAFDGARHDDATNVEAHLRAGDLRLDMGDAAGAEQTYRDGLATAPANPELLLGMGLAELALGHRAEAMEIRARIELDYGTAGGSVAARLALLTRNLAAAP